MGRKRFRNFLILGCTIIVILSVMCFALIDFAANEIFLVDSSVYDPINAIGMILPMSFFMFKITQWFTKVIYKCVVEIINGLEEVAHGNFNVQLDLKKSGPLEDVFKNFNTMVNELKQISTLSEDFINNFSHEFKTPITSINGFASLLKDPNISEEDKKMYIDIIYNESEKLASLANSTLLMSKLENQNIIFNKNYYLLDEQIKECIILLSPQWNEKNIEFHIQLDECNFYGNKDLMDHIWINLINNAIKYTPENGNISVKLINDDNINVIISDDGMGMDEDTKAHIFDKYFQGDLSRSMKGLGLGLSIVKRIVELSRGNIYVTSKLNEGTTFKIVLPKEEKIKTNIS